MAVIVLTDEQARLAEQSGEPVWLEAPDGRVIGTVEPFRVDDRTIEEAKARLASDEPRVPAERVQAHLRALEEEAGRTGSMDAESARAYLRKLREEERR